MASRISSLTSFSGRWSLISWCVRKPRVLPILMSVFSSWRRLATSSSVSCVSSRPNSRISARSLARETFMRSGLTLAALVSPSSPPSPSTSPSSLGGQRFEVFVARLGQRALLAVLGVLGFGSALALGSRPCAAGLAGRLGGRLGRRGFLGVLVVVPWPSQRLWLAWRAWRGRSSSRSFAILGLISVRTGRGNGSRQLETRLQRHASSTGRSGLWPVTAEQSVATRGTGAVLAGGGGLVWWNPCRGWPGPGGAASHSCRSS